MSKSITDTATDSSDSDNIAVMSLVIGDNTEEPTTVTTKYEYTNTAWGDLLTAYDGNSITYDEIGNPVSYYNGYNFSWEQGRQLQQVSNSTRTIATYTYNTDGIRIGKKVGSTTTEYFLDSSGTIQAITQGAYKLVFFYDSTGKREGFTYYVNDKNYGNYYYLYNIQGDVEAIVDSNFLAVVLYEYDSWGKLLSTTTSGSKATTVGKLNPFRYRGYIYDTETGFYYLNSRYYDPETGRFLNADSAISGIGGDVRGYNLYSYCFNNPINMSDPDGNWPKWVERIISKVINKVSIAIVNTTKAVKSSVTLVNYVRKKHITTPTLMLNLGTLFGKVGFSTTVTKQDKDPGLIHSYSDIGNDASKYAVGINVAGWLGANAGVSTELNAFVSAQVTPWIHGEVSLGIDGIGVVVGLDVKETSYDFEINGGWGLILIFVAPQIAINGGQQSGVPAY